MTPAAFILGAGSSSRFASGDKLAAGFRGQPLVHWALSAALEAGIPRVHLVWGAVDLAHLVPDGVELVHNPSWADGQATSLARVIEVARTQAYGSVVVGLADQPLIGAEAWRRVAASTAPIGVATYDGRRRNPVRFDSSVWGLLPVTGDHGARSVMQERDDLVEEIPCPGNPIDIDTLEDLDRWT